METGSTLETCVPLQLPDQCREEPKLAGSGSWKARKGWKGFFILVSECNSAKLEASEIQSCRLDPVFTTAIVRDPFCSQLMEQKLLCSRRLALVLCWLLIHDKRLFQIYSGSYSSWPKNFPAEISPFSFPDYDDRFSWTLLADQKTYGIAIGWLPVDLPCDYE